MLTLTTCEHLKNLLHFTGYKIHSVSACRLSYLLTVHRNVLLHRHIPNATCQHENKVRYLYDH